MEVSIFLKISYSKISAVPSNNLGQVLLLTFFVN